MARQGGLEHGQQFDFSAGMFPLWSRDLIDNRGAHWLTNVLLDRGKPYKRGGTAWTPGWSVGAAKTFMWSGWLLNSEQTLFSAGGVWYVWDYVTPAAVNVGGTGHPFPDRPAVIDGVMYLGNGTMYAGAYHANYSTGTVTGAINSTILDGTGVSWGANINVGSILSITGSTPVYPVKRVISNTQLELNVPLDVAVAGATYVARPLFEAGQLGDYAPGTSPPVATIADRLIVGETSRVKFSARGGEGNVQFFPDNNFHDLPDGARVYGLAVLGQSVLVFTDRGTWSILNMSLEIVDSFGNPQQRMRKISDMSMSSPRMRSGIAYWEDQVIVPADDGLWLMSETGQKLLLSRSINNLYLQYFGPGGTGMPGGGTVFRNHYLLPIDLGGSVSSATGGDGILVCRLDAPVQTAQGIVFPWTEWIGDAGSVLAFAQRNIGEGTGLFGAGPQSALVDLTGCWTPSTTNTLDGDGLAPAVSLETRSFGRAGERDLMKRAALRYDLTGGSNPVVEGWVGNDDGTFKKLDTVGPAGVQERNHWRVNHDGRDTFLSFRMGDPAATFTAHAVDVWARQRGETR